MSGVSADGSRIVSVSATVWEWRGPVAPIPERISISASDMVAEGEVMRDFAFHSWLVVEVRLADGSVGLGNAALAPEIAKAVVERYLEPIVIGQSVRDIELVWQRMYRRTIAFGRKGVVMAAISAVDIALWDALGHHLGVPVYALLGGRVRNPLIAYASKIYHQPADGLQREAKGYADAGYGAVKMRLGYGPDDGAAGMAANIRDIALVREAVGPEVDLMVEAYMGWTLEYARRILPRLEEFDLRWLEEPLIADDVEGYVELAGLTSIPIAAGEHEHTIWGFRRLLEGRAIGVVQFDTNRVGGISQARKIVAMAEAFSVPVVPHAGQAHNYHVSSSSLACPIVEYFPMGPVEIGNELFWYIFDGEAEAKGGTLTLPDTPGLGLTLSDAHCEHFILY